MHTLLHILSVSALWTVSGLALWAGFVGLGLRFEAVGEREVAAGPEVEVTGVTRAG